MLALSLLTRNDDGALAQEQYDALTHDPAAFPRWPT